MNMILIITTVVSTVSIVMTMDRAILVLVSIIVAILNFAIVVPRRRRSNRKQ